jgi:hypothetical protein
MFNRLFALLAVFLPLASNLVAQQTCKPVDIPVSVMSVKGDTFRGLAPEDFVAQLQHKPVALKSLTYDDGPRRVLFVVDTSKKLSADTRKSEVMMIEAMLAAARPEDTFALLPARGPGREVDFTSDKRAITQAIEDRGKPEGKEPGVLDAVMAGIDRFGKPQTGDAIVVIAAELEGNHKANAKSVAKALEEHHIRMFGLALGPVSTRNVAAGGTVTSTTTQGLAYTTPLTGGITYNTGDEHFFPLTVDSGGLVLGVMNVDSRRSYNLADARLAQEVQQKARAVLNMITALYRLQLDGPPLSRAEDWTLDISDALKKQLQQVFLLYPRALGPC